MTPNIDRTAYAKQLDAAGNLPDILQSVNPAGFAQAGKLAPFTDDELKNFIAPKAGAIGGKVYQLPYNTQVIPVVYYNKDLFAKAGITAPPKTYQELLDISKKLKDGGTTPFIVGGGGADTWADMYPLTGTVATDVYKKTPDWLLQRAQGKVKFTDPDFVAAAKKIEDLAKNEYIDPAGLSQVLRRHRAGLPRRQGRHVPHGLLVRHLGRRQQAGLRDRRLPLADRRRLPGHADLHRRWHPGERDREERRAGQEVGPGVRRGQGEQRRVRPQAPTARSRRSRATPRPPTWGPVYNATVEIYQKGMADGSIFDAFSQEAGDGALPPGLADKAALGVQDLITGKKNAQQFAEFLDDEYAKGEHRSLTSMLQQTRHRGARVGAPRAVGRPVP